MIGIYKFTNKFNGKIYIGKSKNIERRYKCHIKDSKTDEKNYFHRALKKYGSEGFDFEVLIECPWLEGCSKEEIKKVLDYWEIFYIKYYNSNNKEYGYNQTEGGDGISIWSEELAHKQSIRYKDKPRTGNPEDWKWSDESKQTQSESRTNWYKEHPEAKINNKIIQKKRFEDPNEHIKTSEATKKGMAAISDEVKIQMYKKQRDTLNNRSEEAKEATRRKRRENPKTKIFAKCCTGRKKINNGIIEKTILIEELEYYKSLGFIEGRLKKN